MYTDNSYNTATSIPIPWLYFETKKMKTWDGCLKSGLMSTRASFPSPHGYGYDSPREPHALARGPSGYHTNIFRIERARLKTEKKITDFL